MYQNYWTIWPLTASLSVRWHLSKLKIRSKTNQLSLSSNNTKEPEVKDVLSKLTEKDPVQEVQDAVQMIPEASTKVISSLFRKLSHFNPILTETEENDVEEDVFLSLPSSPSKKAKQIAINAFYEDVFNKCRIGQLQSSFERDELILRQSSKFSQKKMSKCFHPQYFMKIYRYTLGIQ